PLSKCGFDQTPSGAQGVSTAATLAHLGHKSRPFRFSGRPPPITALQDQPHALDLGTVADVLAAWYVECSVPLRQQPLDFVEQCQNGIPVKLREETCVSLDQEHCKFWCVWPQVRSIYKSGISVVVAQMHGQRPRRRRFRDAAQLLKPVTRHPTHRLHLPERL